MEYLLFEPKHVKTPNCNINIDSNNITPNDSAKHLGVVIQSGMFMDKHISAIVTSCFLQLLNFHRIRSFISKTAVITRANAFVYAHIDYCNSLFCGPCKYSIHRLQKNTARIKVGSNLQVKRTICSIVMPT